ncbi:MAG TPA: TerC/Alx family metal homeostasis membrane protein [Kofleriaceae bacterium]|nr:TerC/Alx family metal homeostasis membrane protein [Kofleriaceae bacterium]
MALFWLGFFALVALLLVIDLGVLHRRANEQNLRSAALQTAGWAALGLGFSGVVYLIYEHRSPGHGTEASVTYVSAYLLEQALSVDNIFVMALVFQSFRVPGRYQHRVLFWGILGAIGFRVTMLAGGNYLVQQFHWVFYIFGAYLAWQGIKLFRPDGGAGDERDGNVAVRLLRRFVRIVDGDHGGKFLARDHNGRRGLTVVAVCLVVIELTDIIFALDSIPAVLSVSNQTFIMVTSNIFAILGLRSLYFVLAGAMAKFQYLKLALGVLLIAIGAKMIAHRWYHMPHLVSLAIIAGILAVGVLASVIATRRAAHEDPGDSRG